MNLGIPELLILFVILAVPLTVVALAVLLVRSLQSRRNDQPPTQWGSPPPPPPPPGRYG